MDWEEKPELNITPLVDVMLVLLAILMVITPNIVYEELINLPQGSAKSELKQKRSIHIVIDKKRTINVNKKAFILASFEDNFYQFAQEFDKKSTVLISADRSLNYGLVMRVLAAVKRSGFTEVSLATSSQ